MPALDETDSRILKILFEDGRRSFREISRLSGVTTPTVQARVKRMMDSGLIRSFSPILDSSKFEQGIVCLLYLAVNPSDIEQTAEKLGKRQEVRGIYLTTGEDNLVLRVVVDSLNDLQHFSEMLDREFGAKQRSSQMVVRAYKDDQSVLLRPGTGVRLKCETCSGSITGKPFLLKVAGRERYFCCRTCLEKFQEKYEVKLKGLSITVETPDAA
jgi:Lrp/AsnC family transcriptional regulator, leucine-responsive regulatory protein